MEKGISVVLLSYKEADNLRILLPKIKKNVEKCGEDFEILVIDAPKKLDRTKEICDLFDVRYYHQEKPHFGGALRTGIKYAKKDKFLILDSDGSHLPKYIPAIYQKFESESCDIVIGSRYVKGGKNRDKALSVFMSQILNLTYRTALNLKVRDLSTDYRMYDTAQLKRVKLKCDHYDVLQEVLVKMRLRNNALKVEEVPICFEKRLYGRSKRKMLRFMLSYLKTLIYLMGLCKKRRREIKNRTD